MGLKFIRRVKIEGTDLGALPKGGKGTVVRGFTGPKNMLKNPGFLMAEPLDADRLKIRLVKNSFYEFVKEFWSTVVAERPVWNWHIKYLCDQAQAVMERVMREEPKEYDLVTNVPPGTSKSTIFSIMLPAWAWARKPSLRFICCSYDSNLAWNLSRKCRKVIKSEKYQRWFPEVSLVSDQDTKTLFANSEGGERYAVGSGGGIIGNHAHCIIIDDPLDPKRAASDVELEAVNNWIKEELSGRKVDKRVTATMVIMQRLHQTDPSAVMVKSGGVRHIKLPATTEGEVLPAELEVNYKDGLLDPIRMPQSVLEEIKAGPRGMFVFSGQYLQDPVPPGGGMFQTFKFMVDKPPPLAKFKRLVRYWDKAATQSGGAYTVGLLMGTDPDDVFWVLDVVRVQFDSNRREKLILSTAQRDGRGVWVGLEQEPGSGGKESTENTVRNLAGFIVRYNKPTGDKELRADPYSVQVNAGNVRLAPGKWNDDYIEELRYFPFSTYKDQVDASSGAFGLLYKKKIRLGGLE